MLSEDEQAAVIEEEFPAIVSVPGVCGATIWCYADHPWPPGAYVAGLADSPFGVVSRERRPLKAYAVARRLFHAKQGAGEPGAAAYDDPAGAALAMVRPHMNDIPQFAFPDGFSGRPMLAGEGALWTDIQRDAEPYHAISDDLFALNFGADLAATTWRCFFIVDSRGVAAGTLSAWYDRNFKGGDWGRIHWVAVRPAYQRRGLARAALTFAMGRLAQWHARAMLTTEASAWAHQVVPGLRVCSGPGRRWRSRSVAAGWGGVDAPCAGGSGPVWAVSMWGTCVKMVVVCNRAWRCHGARAPNTGR